MNEQIEIVDGGKHTLHAAQGEMFWTCGNCGECVMLATVAQGSFPMSAPDTHHTEFNGACTCGTIGVTVNRPHDGSKPYAEYSFTEHETELDDDGIYYGTLVFYDVYEDDDDEW